MYTCTCMDATLHSTVCKHMHFLHNTISRQEDGYKVIQNMNKALKDEKDDDMTEYNSKSDDKETESESGDGNESGKEIPSMETDDQAEPPQIQFNNEVWGSL